LSGVSAGAGAGTFNRMVRTAAAAGILAGLLLTGVQHMQVTSIIAQAEVLESEPRNEPVAHAHAEQAPVQPTASAPAEPVVHTHADGARHTHVAPQTGSPESGHESSHQSSHESAADSPHGSTTSAAGMSAAESARSSAGSLAGHATNDTHDTHDAHDAHDAPHEHGGWQPENGNERTFYTALADVSMGVGYGLLLAAAIGLRGQPVDWRIGLLWGVAGYAVFFLAPSLGLPPELPGTAAAPLAARQGWWIATAMSTATALALLAFGRHWALKLAALALLFVPHLVGAPQPLVHASVAPETLQSSFVYATALANGVFWLALGGLAGFFYKRFSLSTTDR
jgi:cobalt transporter subunit CbtA